MSLSEIFKADGNFRNERYDPYRSSDSTPEIEEIHNFLFDEDGSLNHDLWVNNVLVTYIEQYQCSPFSDIVKLMWAHEMGMNTKGSYPAIYMWR